MNGMQIGEILLTKGLVDDDRLKRGLEEQAISGERLGSVLVRLGYVPQRDVVSALSAQLGFPTLFSEDYPEDPPETGLKPFERFLKNYKLLPVLSEGGVLKVVASDPSDPYPFEALGAATGLKIEIMLGAEDEILGAIDSFYGRPESMESILEGMGEEEGPSAPEADDAEHLKGLAHEAPVINLVNMIITKALEKRASDIHIEPFEGALHVRYRIDGVLYPAQTLPKGLQPAIASRVKIMSKLNIAERRLPQDGRIRLNALGKEVDVRVSTVPTLYGESIVMRLLDPTGLKSLEDIGFPEAAREAFESLIRQPHGMILVTGPTGSGKSTTLYAALSRIDTVQKKVITIEDPVEYNFKGVNQIQVKPKIGFSFANGLRSIVRQDPDVIMVGEIRDAETADIAVHSALTGHLILSTLHTNDAPGAATRLMDMGVESYLISSSLLGVLAQRLVRVICPECKEPYSANGTAQEIIEYAGRMGLLDNGGLTLWKGRGCAGCDNTGYRGRTCISELMPVDDGIRLLITGRRGADEIRKKAMEQGMRTLRQDGWDKAIAGITTFEEVARVTLEQL